MIRVSLTRYVCTDFSGPQSLVSHDKCFPSSRYREDAFRGVLSPAFRQKREGQSALLASAVFEVPLTQNNQCARMAYFGVEGGML